MATRTMSAVLVFLCAACAGAPEAGQAPVADPATRRATSLGDVVGAAGPDGGHTWRGLPFAAPPTGDLRWRAPRPAEPWEGERSALSTASMCPQLTNSLDVGLEPGVFRGDEDCLYLNVFAPAGGSTGDLPVMVFIHGGANVWGHGGQYDGERLAVRHDLVVVTINYRLGPLGWFAHGALRDSAQNPDDRAANFAVLDMIAALEWVRREIAVFGGDPDRVTIFGQSAGGHNVASLLAAPRSEGLYHGAIMQSGYFQSRTPDAAEFGAAYPGGETHAGARAIAASVLARAGAADLDQDAAAPEDIAAALRSVSVEDAYAAAYANGDPGDPLMIADGVVLTADSIEAAFVSPSTHVSVPLMTGGNRDETRLMLVRDPGRVAKRIGLLRPRDARLYEVLSDYQSEAWLILAVDEPAQRVSATGGQPVYAYQFDWDEEGRFLWSDYALLLGAAHAMELPFVFDSFDTFAIGGDTIFPPREEASRRALSDAMMSYWAEFAYAGDPGRGREGAHPRWNAWTQGAGDDLMVFDSSHDGGVRMRAVERSIVDLFARLEVDPRLHTTDERCDVSATVVRWFPETVVESEDFLAGECQH